MHTFRFRGISRGLGRSITASEGFIDSLQGSLRGGVVRAVMDGPRPWQRRGPLPINETTKG